jgi:four helix bundle protein
MKVFHLIKDFPQEEKYDLCSQMRRSSRSVSSSIAEAYRKRKYPAHFVSKISDADMENTETQTWFDYALACKYINKTIYNELTKESEEVGKLLNYMMENPGKFS